jgi:CHAT domain-containing protein
MAAGKGLNGPDDDGRLEVHEVNRLEISASLVFLSGCETGLGISGATSFHTGEDYATLTRAFLSAGAANVVATLWRVEDRGAAEFAGIFYRALAGTELRPATGDGPLAEALSRTQREMIHSSAWSAPFYWAGYRITGSGARVPEKSGGGVRS